MLVLSRKVGERILIGDEVAITVTRIGPNSISIGIDAPREMNIVREELASLVGGVVPVVDLRHRSAGNVEDAGVAVSGLIESPDAAHVPALAGATS